METNANYVSAGLFIVLSLLVAIIYSILNSTWLNENNINALDIYIDSSISGLNVGSQVLFNGIVVGKVDALSFDANNLNRVIAHCSLNDAAPIRPSTIAELGYVGITGTAYINLRGGNVNDPLLFNIAKNTKPYKVPILYAHDAGLNKLMSTSGTTLQQATLTLQHIDKLLANLQPPLNKSLNNIAELTETLKNRRKDFDQLTLQSKLTLAAVEKAANTINQMFSASTKRNFDSLEEKLANSTRAIDRIERSTHILTKNPQRIIWGQGRGDNVPIFGAGH